MTRCSVTKVLATLVFWHVGGFVFAQTSGKFTQDYPSTPLTEVLTDFKSQCGFSFSYDPDLVAPKTVLDFSAEGSPCQLSLVKALQSCGMHATPIGGNKFALGARDSDDPATATHLDLIRGRVTDSETGIGLPGAVALIPNTGAGSYTDDQGKFEFVIRRSDADSLEIRYIGYQSQSFPLDKSGAHLQIKLKSNPLELASVVVTGRSELPISKGAQTSGLALNPRRIDAVAVLGEKDVFRTMQFLPGVSSTEESSNGLYIRGGTPDQNLVLIDDIPIYNTGHFFGMFHAFNADALDRIEVSRSGFNVEHGGASAALVDIHAKPKVGDSLEAGVTANLAAASAYLVLPFQNKRSALMLAGRRSYSDIIQSPLYKLISGNVFQTGTIFENENNIDEDSDTEYVLDPLSNFHDLHAKFITDFRDGGRLSATFYNGRDIVRYTFIEEDTTEDFDRISEERLTLRNTAVGLKYEKALAKNLEATASSYYSSFAGLYLNDQFISQEDDSITYFNSQNNSVRSFSVKTGLSWKPKAGHLLRGGLQFQRLGSEFNLEDNEDFGLEDNDSLALFSSIFSIYLAYDLQHREKLKLSPGIRLSRYLANDETVFEPRFRASYTLGKGFRLNSNLGFYHQFLNPVQINNSLRLGTEFLALANDEIGIEATQSIQSGLGVSWIKPGLWVDLQGYYKRLYGLERYARSFDQNTNANEFGKLLLDGDGSVWGMDLLIRGHKGPFTGWAGYTLSRVTHFFRTLNEGNPFPADHDHLHELKLVGVWENERWETSVTWMFASGKPYSRPESIRTDTIAGTDDVNYELDFQRTNNLRLPAYHRLDVNAAYKFPIKGWAKGKVGIALFNVYNRENIRDRNYSIEYPDDENDPLEIVVIDRHLLGLSPNLFLRIQF